MFNLFNGRPSAIFNESVPNIMHTIQNWACEVDFDVRLVDGLTEAFVSISDAFTKIVEINRKIDSLYESTDTVRGYLRMYEGYLHVYNIHSGTVYQSFEQIAGTLEHVHDMIRDYKEQLTIIYDEPKRVLEKERIYYTDTMHNIAAKYNWIIESELSADPEKRPKITVRSI